MKRFSKFLARGAVAAVLGVGALAVMSASASAEVACNRYGDCWQTTQRYHYPVHLSVRYSNHSDSYWRNHRHNGYRWHDEQNRDNGYWDSDRAWHDNSERDRNRGYWDNDRNWHNN